MRVMVLGAGGMLGSAMTRVLAGHPDLEVCGTLRDEALHARFPVPVGRRLIGGVDLLDNDTLVDVLARMRPQVVINCVGIIKQLPAANDPLVAIPVNSVLPHRLARLCELADARLVHFSTDCVFSGSKGNYVESDAADAADLYGRSKYLGELHHAHTLTLRTSIIGHQLRGCNSLIDWFLAQQQHCRGFTRAVFSGLPAVVLARIVRDVIIPRPELYGLYHVASRPICKFELLKLVAGTYGKTVEIVGEDSPVIDRSLNAQRFQTASGYSPPQWPELVDLMYADYRENADRQNVQK
jgi:dTDP-4-dehydrorhamnose reductase